MLTVQMHGFPFAVSQEEAARVGYPLLVKAVLGGGGKGMKLAREPGQFLVRAAGCLSASGCPCCVPAAPLLRPCCVCWLALA